MADVTISGVGLKGKIRRGVRENQVKENLDNSPVKKIEDGSNRQVRICFEYWISLKEKREKGDSKF